MKIIKKLLLTLVICAMTLTVVGLPEVNASEGGNDYTTATPINLGPVYEDTIGGTSTATPDAYDWYYFDLSKTTTIKMKIKIDATSGIRFGIVNAYGNDVKCELDYGSSTETDQFYYSKLPAGRYYILFYSDDNTFSNYKFYVQEHKGTSQKFTNVKGSYTITYSNPKSYATYLRPRVADGNPGYTYKSSNTKVLTVNKNGYIYTKAYGKATVTITAKVPTSGYRALKYKTTTKKVTITVRPQAMKNAGLANYKKVKKKKKTVKQIIRKQLKVTWTRDKLATGYQVQIAKNKKFTSGLKSYTSKSNKTVSKTFTKLKKGSKYYMRARAYKTINGKKVYGPWVVTRGTIKVL